MASFNYEIANILLHYPEDLPIAAIHTKGHSDALPIPAGYFKAIGAPATTTSAPIRINEPPRVFRRLG